MIRLLHAILILATLSEITNWKTDRRPKIYGHRVPDKLISTNLKKVQRRIVMLHDYFRTKVSPSAGNMLNMKWHRGAARSAQKWADRCRFLIHDTPKGRQVGNFNSCGQNIFISTLKVPWLFALRTWFMERHNFTYGSNKNQLSAVGHYTQLVWASTHKIGCGISKCRNLPKGNTYYNYVCNYCPSGNFEDRLGFPYKIGQSCSSCRGSCRKRVRLCTNFCNTVDLWANCAQLYSTWPAWLCDTSSTIGLSRQKSCAATCTCHGKIYD